MTEQDVMKIMEEELATTLKMDVEGQWDSLDYVVILQRLDEELKGKMDDVPEQELSTMTTPRKVIDLLRKHKAID